MNHGTTSGGPVFVKLDPLRKKGKEGHKKYLKTNAQNIFKVDEDYKPIDPSYSMDFKCRKHEENYSKVHHHNQIA